jgi:hypothetical protein
MESTGDDDEAVNAVPENFVQGVHDGASGEGIPQFVDGSSTGSRT